MALDGLVRKGTKIAKKVTKRLQGNITHAAWTGKDKKSKPTYATATTIPAIIDLGPKPFRTAQGVTITVKAMIYILQPISANGASGRHEPVDPRDKITLPDGTVGAPIQGSGGLLDPTTSYPYFHTVALG